MYIKIPSWKKEIEEKCTDSLTPIIKPDQSISLLEIYFAPPFINNQQKISQKIDTLLELKKSECIRTK